MATASSSVATPSPSSSQGGSMSSKGKRSGGSAARRLERLLSGQQTNNGQTQENDPKESGKISASQAKYGQDMTVWRNDMDRAVKEQRERGSKWTPEEGKEKFKKYEDERSALGNQAPVQEGYANKLARFMKGGALKSLPDANEQGNNPRGPSPNADQNASVLDASNYGKRPYEKSTDGGSDDQKSKNENFQQEMKDMGKRQEQFSQGGRPGENQTGDPSNLSESSEDSLDQTGGRSGSPLEQDKRRQQTQRADRAFRAQNQQALNQARAEEEANQKIASGSFSNVFTGLWELARGRGRRFVTASTGVGVFFAIAESDLILYNRLFKNGTVRILPGSRPEGAYEADPSLRNDDYKELGINMILHVMGIVMLFLGFIQALPILFPFMIAVLGAAVLQQELGPAVADLILQLAN